jgi:DNA-binding transcriptional ArsR family regulator
VRNPERLFQALADATRLKALALIIRNGELCVCDVMNVLEITQSKASRHLRYLANAGLLNDRRETVWSYYRMADGLSPEQQRIIDSVPGLLGADVLGELEKSLSTCKNRKCCEIPMVKASTKEAPVEAQS